MVGVGVGLDWLGLILGLDWIGWDFHRLRVDIVGLFRLGIGFDLMIFPAQ